LNDDHIQFPVPVKIQGACLSFGQLQKVMSNDAFLFHAEFQHDFDAVEAMQVD